MLHRRLGRAPSIIPCTPSACKPVGRHAVRWRGRPPASLPVNDEVTISEDDMAKVEELQMRFQLFDVDKTGEISRERLRQLLQSVDLGTTTPLLSQHWVPDSELDRVMQVYDKDQSGSINFEEFMSIVTDGLLLDGTLTEYEEAFNAVDKSGNGTIGAMELFEVLKNLGQEVTFEKLSAVMEKYDMDESGQIEFHEFLMMFRDQLLDLKAMKNFLAGVSAPDQSIPKSEDILELEEGGISLIFSEQELEAVMSRRDKLVVVYVALTWCRPCKAMARPLARLAQHYKDSYVFIKLFGNSNEQTRRIFQDILKVRSTPCFMIFKDQTLMHTQVGPNKEKLEDALRAHVLEGKMPKGRLYFPQT